MSRFRKFAAAVGGASAVVPGAAMPAQAVNEADCARRSDFPAIRLPQRRVCHANAGVMDVALVSPEVISSGDNDVRLTFRSTSGDHRVSELLEFTTISRSSGLPRIPRAARIEIL